MNDKMLNGNGLMIKVAYGILQAIIVGVLLWVGNTVANLNREVGALHAKIEALEREVNRLEREHARVSRSLSPR